ncbi:hypothetical protein INP83_11050 [Mucilaginibacter sp. 21P]|uniref:hypothetical protein n=1 Tax=Mucilaginibacter sp. 21P TaxID=2778902 RepID=UPI001C58C917|nr:hypothetical protein [Mucilaginibacter sp. 21P]QXV63652.1 hypothetical protein INP83_11050 [Mucilaginibacter sp. 21P]
MNGPFLITVTWQGAEQEYKARFERWGYTHRISVLIAETMVVFEPDEEGGYRALNTADTAEIPMEILQRVAEKLVALSR